MGLPKLGLLVYCALVGARCGEGSDEAALLQRVGWSDAELVQIKEKKGALKRDAYEKVNTKLKAASTDSLPPDLAADAFQKKNLAYGNIQIIGGTLDDRSLLSCTAEGEVDLRKLDDGSGRQQWVLEESPSGGWTHIKVVSGTNSGEKFLSATSDGSLVDLYDHDDGSGRQRWVLEKVWEFAWHVKIYGGISNERTFLSATADGAKVDLWERDDGSGRQKWTIMSPEFQVTSGSCKVDAGCVTSPNYPQNYEDNQACTIEAPRTALALHSFETENGFDELTVNGVVHSGHREPTQEPNDIVPAETIRWTSDYSVPGKGWKLCLAAEAAHSAQEVNSQACNTNSWPDIDKGRVCGPCKVLVDRFDSEYGSSCSNYCKKIQRDCVGQWEEVDDTCGVKYSSDCSQTIAGTSDAICECNQQDKAPSVIKLDTSASGKGPRRRRTGHTYATRSYPIKHGYAPYGTCRSTIFSQPAVASLHSGWGASMKTFFYKENTMLGAWARLWLFEDMDCEGRRHDFEISGNLESEWDGPDKILVQTEDVSGSGEIESFGFALNNHRIFDGRNDLEGDPGEPWFRGAKAHKHEPRQSSSTFDERDLSHYYDHEDQTWCLDMFENKKLNGKNFNCELLKNRNDSNHINCNLYDDPGQHVRQCCTMTGHPNYDLPTEFCAFNVPSTFRNKMQSWVFGREHRRRITNKNCAERVAKNTDTTLGNCFKDQLVQFGWDVASWGWFKAGDVWASSNTAKACESSCATGGYSSRCGEAVLWQMGGYGVAQTFAYGVGQKLSSSFAPVGGHILAATTGLAINWASCWVNELRRAGKGCLAPSTLFRGTDENHVPLASIDVGSTLTVVNVNNISRGGEVVGQTKVVSGKILGFARKKDHYLRVYMQLKTTSGKFVRCTPKHYLWVKGPDGPSKLVLAENVRLGQSLPLVGSQGGPSIEWEEVKEIKTGIVEEGAIVPIARTSDWETADMVVTETGLVVPIYAGGPEYSALAPADAHRLFKAWLHHWSKLGAELPCIMKISHGTQGSEMIEILQKFGEQHHPGKLGKLEMNPPEFLCFLLEHADEFRGTIMHSDLKLVQECEGLVEMAEACNGNLMSKVDAGLIKEDGGKVLPDDLSNMSSEVESTGP